MADNANSTQGQSGLDDKYPEFVINKRRPQPSFDQMKYPVLFVGIGLLLAAGILIYYTPATKIARTRKFSLRLYNRKVILGTSAQEVCCKYGRNNYSSSFQKKS